jgi:hypothetical protein
VKHPWPQGFHRVGRAVLASSVIAAATAVLATPSPAVAAVPGLQYISASTGFDSTVYKSVDVTCPGTQVVLGGGYQLQGGEGSVVLDDFIPSGHTMHVGAGEVVGAGEPTDGTTANWRIVATAVCAGGVPGWEIVTRVSEFNTGTARQVDAICPSGKRVIGGGASLANGWGQISINSLDLNDNYTEASAIDDEDGFSGAWSITAYAICANPLPGIQHALWGTGADSISPKTSTATCAAGSRVLSAGWQLRWPPNAAQEQVLNTSAFIAPGGTAVTTIEYEDDTGYSGTWGELTQAICATS